ncbi:unnamed protein product [Durusdinium trenchii]|uniref:EF-hand domain-containing protein n=1 Tax=Durusdinium trenchii TaxID=1381693 RepID=A0ABP0SA27_9DINO
MDVDLSRLDKQRQAMHGWISSSFFDSFIGFIILINAVIIGFEAEVSTQIPFGCDESCQCGDAGRQSECFAMPEWLQAVDYVFAGIYIAEFGLSVYCGLRGWRVPCTLLWTFLMVMILVYGFAIVGIETIHVDLTLPLEHPYNVAVMQNFDRFSDAMLTLFQCFTLDSAGEVYRPLITHNPVLIAYFMTVILVMAVSLMNLVTAIMVNSALDQASEDKDVKRAYEAVQKRKQLEQLKVMFLELDTDGSGELTLEELKTAPEEVREQLEAVAGTEDIEGLFQMLDYDGGGSLDTSEFCEGVLKASTSEKPLELTRLVKQCSDILRLCHLVPSCKRKTRLPCFLPFRPMRAFPFAPLSHRPEHVCEPEAEDSRSVSQGILEFQLRGRSWERIWAKPSANAGLHFGIIDLFIYIYIYHFFQRLCR